MVAPAAPVWVVRLWQSQQVRVESMRDTMSAWQRTQLACVVRRPRVLSLIGSGTAPVKKAAPLVPSTDYRSRWGTQWRLGRWQSTHRVSLCLPMRNHDSCRGFMTWQVAQKPGVSEYSRSLGGPNKTTRTRTDPRAAAAAGARTFGAFFLRVGRAIPRMTIHYPAFAGQPGPPSVASRF